MDEKFAGIKGVGFDLDQTLYPDSAETRSAVRNEIYRTIAEYAKIPFKQAAEKFEAAYTQTGSGGRAIENCGVPNGKEVLRDCLVSADVAKILKRDDRLIDIFRRMHERYQLFLITDSRTENAYSKLDALGIDPDIFSIKVCWDMFANKPGMVNKSDGTAFDYVQNNIAFPPNELVYVGNSEKDDIIHPADKGWRTIHLSDTPSSRATAGINEIYDLERLLL